MPTSQELYQEYLDSKKEEAEKLYQEFHRTQEMPLIEKESKQRINQYKYFFPYQAELRSPSIYEVPERYLMPGFQYAKRPGLYDLSAKFRDYETLKSQLEPLFKPEFSAEERRQYVNLPFSQITQKQAEATPAMLISIGRRASMLDPRLHAFIEKSIEEMPTGYKKEILDKHPVAQKVGQAFGEAGKYAVVYWGLNELGLFGLGPKITSGLISHGVSQGISSFLGGGVGVGAVFSLIKELDNLSDIKTGKKEASFGTLLYDPLESYVFGHLFGGSQAIKGAGAAIGIGGGAFGARTLAPYIEKMWSGEDPNWKNLAIEMPLSVALGMLVAYWGHEANANAYLNAVKNRLIETNADFIQANADIINKDPASFMFATKYKKELLIWGFDEQSKNLINLSKVDLHNRDHAVRLASDVVNHFFNHPSPNIRADFSKISNLIANNTEIIPMMTSDIKKGMSPFSAFVANSFKFNTIKLPFLGKQPDFEPTKTIPQLKKGHAVQNDLKKIGFTKEHINTLKGNKSFKQASKEEATRLIKKLEMAKEIAEEYSATDPEGLTDAGINKIVERVNAIDKEVQNVNDFSEKIKKGTPAELINYIGKDYRLYDYARPSRKGFERDPFVYFNGYLPIHDGYTKTKINYEEKAQKAIKLAKKLKLTNEELKDIAERRNLMYFQQIIMSPDVAGRILPILNDRQKKFDDFLTREYMWAHSYFKVKNFVPYQMYNPLLREMHELEGKVIGAFFPEKIPEMIKAFFESERKSSKTEGLRTNALDDYLKYMKAGYKKKFMEGPMRDAQTNIIKNPLVKGTMKKALQQYATWMMGYPTAIEESYIAMFTDLGLKTEDAHQLARTLMNLTYSSAISLRPKLLAKQLLQNLNTANELGYSWAMSGLIDFINNGFSFDEARLAGVLTEYAPEVYQEYGKKYPLDKTRELLTWAFHREDMFGRDIAYKAARNKWDYYYKKSKTIPEFMEKSGVNYLDKVIRWRIKEQLKKGNIYEARRIFYKEIVASTHYLYGKEDSPLAGKTSLGKMALQFKSWPINYGELLIKNFENKNYGFMWRQLLAILFLSAIGIKAKQKWMVGYPVTTFPMTRYSLRRFIGLPASLTMLEDIIALLGESTYRYLDSQDFDKAKKAFEKQLKTLGKDILFYLPGGLALKELYEIKDFIPFGQDNNQEYQGMAP